MEPITNSIKTILGLLKKVTINFLYLKAPQNINHYHFYPNSNPAGNFGSNGEYIGAKLSGEDSFNLGFDTFYSNLILRKQENDKSINETKSRNIEELKEILIQKQDVTKKIVEFLGQRENKIMQIVAQNLDDLNVYITAFYKIGGQNIKIRKVEKIEDIEMLKNEKIKDTLIIGCKNLSKDIAFLLYEDVDGEFINNYYLILTLQKLEIIETETLYFDEKTQVNPFKQTYE